MNKNADDILDKFKDLMKGRDLYTSMELVSMGIYGGRSSVHDAVRNGEILGAYVSARRFVIFKDSILKNIEKRLKGKK